jgi:hypothetical protein
VHLALTVPFLVIVARLPEGRVPGGLAGPWWRQLDGAERCAPAVHARRAAGGAVDLRLRRDRLRLPAHAAGRRDRQLGAGVRDRRHRDRPRRLQRHPAARPADPLPRIGPAASSPPWGSCWWGIAIVALAIRTQSVAIGLGANVVIGVGMGIALVSSLLEVQRIAGARDLAGLTGVFYAAAYAGFLAPAVIAAIAHLVDVQIVLAVIVALGVACWVGILISSRRHLPADAPDAREGEVVEAADR